MADTVGHYSLRLAHKVNGHSSVTLLTDGVLPYFEFTTWV